MLLFRQARKTDRDVLADLYARCLHEADWLPEELKTQADYDRNTSGEKVFVAEDDGRIVGFVAVWEPESFIHHLYVDPSEQGRGIGSFLLDQLAFEMEPPWRLKCVVKNERARMFYDARGWTSVELMKDESGLCEVLQFG